MGNNFSQKDSLKINANKEKIGLFIKDSFSSYKGVIDSNSDNLSGDTKLSEMNIMSVDKSNQAEISLHTEVINQEKEEALKNLVPHTFTWQEDGLKVFLVGSFENWEERYEMKKINKEFTKTLVRIKLLLLN